MGGLRWWEWPMTYVSVDSSKTSTHTHPPINTHCLHLALTLPPSCQRASAAPPSPRPLRTARPAVGTSCVAPELRTQRLKLNLINPGQTGEKEVNRNMTSKAMEHLNLSEEQTTLLEDSFKKLGKHPDGTTLMLIAAECGLSEEETQVSRYVKYVCFSSGTGRKRVRLMLICRWADIY